MMHVYIAQLLCPERHCMIAVAGEVEEGTEEALGIKLRKVATEGVESGKFKPICILCGAPYDSFEVEIERSKFATLEEAMPKLRETEAAQRQLSEWCQSMNLTFKEISEHLRKAKGAMNN